MEKELLEEEQEEYDKVYKLQCDVESLWADRPDKQEEVESVRKTLKLRKAFLETAKENV